MQAGDALLRVNKSMTNCFLDWLFKMARKFVKIEILQVSRFKKSQLRKT